MSCRILRRASVSSDVSLSISFRIVSSNSNILCCRGFMSCVFLLCNVAGSCAEVFSRVSFGSINDISRYV